MYKFKRLISLKTEPYKFLSLFAEEKSSLLSNLCSFHFDFDTDQNLGQIQCLTKINFIALPKICSNTPTANQAKDWRMTVLYKFYVSNLDGEVEHEAVRVFLGQFVEQLPPRLMIYHLRQPGGCLTTTTMLSFTDTRKGFLKLSTYLHRPWQLTNHSYFTQYWI